MPKRGRWSAEDQRGVVPGIKAPPLNPPPEMAESDAAIWRSITARLPSDWFADGSEALLLRMVRHIRHGNDLERDLAAVRRALDELSEGTGPVPTRSESIAILTREYRDLLRASALQTQTIASLAVKLRLTVQSRVVVQSAAKRARDDAPPQGPEPWDDWRNDEPVTKQ